MWKIAFLLSCIIWLVQPVFFAQGTEELGNMITRGSSDSALVLIQEKLQTNPNNPELYYLKSRCESALQMYNELIGTVTYALQHLEMEDSLSKKLLEIRALTYWRVKEVEKAECDYDELMRHYPNDDGVVLNASFCYTELLKWEKAIKVLEKAVEIHTDDPYLYNNLAYSYLWGGYYEKAIKVAKEGLKYAPDSTWKGILLNNMGYAEYKSGNKKGLKTINKGIHFNPTNSFAYYYRALILIDQGKIDRACEDLYKSRELGGVNITLDRIELYCE